MKILPQRDIEKNVYSVKIKPLEWGTPSLTASEELEMLKDIPQTLKYTDIDFSAKFKVEDGVPVISEDDDAVLITLDLREKEFPLDEKFEVSLSVDAGRITDSEIDDKVLTNRHLVAQAKIIVYETRIIEEITKLLNQAASHINGFINGVKIVNIYNIIDNKPSDEVIPADTISVALVDKLKKLPEITQNDVNQWNSKVDSVEGKQLSTEDFTTELKEKLEGMVKVDTSTAIPDIAEGGFLVKPILA